VKKAWAVIPHSEARRPTGRGFVVRTGDLMDYPLESGAMRRSDRFSINDRYNYGGVEAVRIFERKAAAEKLTDKLNGREQR
jgi:hypothetical protein